jgi:ubiquinone/menaquinone biosynthesis C-methylase UbiE
VATGAPLTSPFARPRGVLGRLAGAFMLRTNRQDELLELLEVQPGDRILEVGYGPGGLIRLLVDHTEASVIHGIDPSSEMRDAAARMNRAAVGAGRVDLRVGGVDRTGLPGRSVDHVVSVNNVTLWPDLHAGLRELHRVARPGGSVLIAWHGGTAPSRIVRHLRLPAETLNQIERGLREFFPQVTRYQLRAVDAFVAIR